MFFESYGDAVTCDAAFPSFRGQRLRRKGVEIYDARGENEIQQRGKERERRKERCETEERESKDCRAFCEKCWASTSRPRPPSCSCFFFSKSTRRKTTRSRLTRTWDRGRKGDYKVGENKRKTNRSLARLLITSLLTSALHLSRLFESSPPRALKKRRQQAEERT